MWAPSRRRLGCFSSRPAHARLTARAAHWLVGCWPGHPAQPSTATASGRPTKSHTMLSMKAFAAQKPFTPHSPPVDIVLPAVCRAAHQPAKAANTYLTRRAAQRFATAQRAGRRPHGCPIMGRRPPRVQATPPAVPALAPSEGLSLADCCKPRKPQLRRVSFHQLLTLPLAQPVASKWAPCMLVGKRGLVGGREQTGKRCIGGQRPLTGTQGVGWGQWLHIEGNGCVTSAVGVGTACGQCVHVLVGGW